MAEEKREFKEAFGLRVYKDGKIENIKSNKEVGFVANSGDYSVYLPDLKTTLKVAVVMIAVWKNDGVLPDVPKKWKILYKDGDKLNCSIDNLDYVDITIHPYTKPDEARDKLYELKLKKVELIEEIEELDEQILDLTWMIASGEKHITKLERIEQDKKRLEARRALTPVVPKPKHKKPTKKLGRPIGSTISIYVINRFDHTYEEMSLKAASKFLGIAEATVSQYASQSTIVPSNQKYAITKNLGDTWDLME